MKNKEEKILQYRKMYQKSNSSEIYIRLINLENCCILFNSIIK